MMSYRGTICRSWESWYDWVWNDVKLGARSLEWLFRLILLQFLKNRHFPYKKLPFLGTLGNLKLLGPDKFSCPQLLRVLNTPYGVPKTLYCHGQLLQSPSTLVSARKLVQTLLTDCEVARICPFLWTSLNIWCCYHNDKSFCWTTAYLDFYLIFESSQTRGVFCWLWNFRSSCCHFAVWAMLASVTIGSNSFQFWLMIKFISSNYFKKLETGVLLHSKMWLGMSIFFSNYLQKLKYFKKIGSWCFCCIPNFKVMVANTAFLTAKKQHRQSHFFAARCRFCHEEET